MIRAAVALALALAGCAHSLPPQRFAAVDSELPSDESSKLKGALADVESLARAFAEQRKLNALVVAVVYRDQLLFWRSVGAQPVNLDTVFSIGSLTKLFAGLALLQLRDQGKLSLDDPLERFLPEASSLIYPTSDSPRVTLRHLVTHSSGLPKVGKIDYVQHELGEKELLGALRDLPLEFAPGTKQSYSNLAMGLVGVVLSRITHRDFHDHLREALLAPLGLASAAWSRAQIPVDKRAPAPGPEWRLGAGGTMGGLYLSVRDLARFASFELDAWPPRSTPDSGPLARATVRESQLLGGTASIGEGFAVSWNVSTQEGARHVVQHTGAVADQAAVIRLLPERGFGVVAMQAADEQHNDADGLSKLSVALVAKLIEAAPEPGPELGTPAQSALFRVEQLLDQPDESAMPEAFAPEFLAKVPADQILQGVKQIRELAGPCHGHTVVSAPSPTEATVKLRCEKTAIEAHLVTSPEPPYRLLGLQLRPVQ